MVAAALPLASNFTTLLAHITMHTEANTEATIATSNLPDTTNHDALATAPEAQNPSALSTDDIDALEALLDDLRTRSDEIPQWEFCDGFLTALACSRRPIAVGEFLSILLGEGDEEYLINAPEGADVPTLPVFASAEQQAQFLQLWQRRFDEVVRQLDTDVKTLDDDRTFQPEAMDMRGAVASLPPEQQADMQGQAIPSFGQVWAVGFMFAVESWSDDWAAPRDKEAARWLNDALDSIVALTEDDTDTPTVCMFSEDGPPSTSQARVEAFGEAIWAVYDLRQVWKSIGPKVHAIQKVATPGRNDPCHCGSGQKYKKCHGA